MSTSSYFLSGLTDEHQRLLTGAHIGCEKFDVGNESGLLLEDIYLQAALQVLQAEVVAQTPTGWDGVHRLQLRGRSMTMTHQIPAQSNSPPRTAQPQPQPQPQPAPAPTVNLTRSLAPIVMQVSKLQAWANLSDSERGERQQLIRQCKTLEQDVRQATDDLRSGMQELNGIQKPVAALKQFKLPEGLGEQLEALVDERNQHVGKTRDHLNTLVADLQQARQALNDHMAQPRLSPEQTLDGASQALADAQALFPEEQQ